MERKKIVIGISGHVFSDQRMKRIGNALSEFGYDVELLYRQHFKYVAVDTKKTAAPEFNTKSYKFPVNSGVLFYLLLNHRYFWSQLFRPADAYYAVDSDTLPAFLLLSIIKGKPLIYDAHEYFCEVPEIKSGLKKWIWDKVTKMGVKRSRVRFTVGPMLAKELSKRYGKPFGTVRNVPLLSQRAIPIKSFERPSIVYQGALNEGRGLELLIDAMKRLPECDCLIIGEGDLSISLRSQAEGYKNIIFKGLLSPEQLRLITPSCFAGFNLLDASNSLSYYFSLSNKYFDYMHAGIPSISSKLPEYLSLNESCGAGICIGDSVDELVETIRVWLQQPEKYEKLKENAIIASKIYNWEIEKEVLRSLIKI